VTEPDADLIFLEPPSWFRIFCKAIEAAEEKWNKCPKGRRLGQSLLAGVKAIGGGLLSKSIGWADPERRGDPGGPYSHCGLRFGNLMRDARKQAGVQPGAEIPKDRPTKRFHYVVDGIPNPEIVANAYDTTVPDNPANPGATNFSMYAMLRLGIVLLTVRRSKRLAPLARLMIRFHPDPGGFFCSEFMAKAIAEANGKFVVKVEKDRLDLVTKPVAKALARHELGGRLGLASTVEVDDLAAAIMELKELLSNSVDSEVELEVGTPPGKIPAVFVTPSDLARSQNASPVEGID
jgi:hypothetical protein